MKKQPHRNELTELAGATTRFDEPSLRLVVLEEKLKNEQLTVRLLVTCLRGVRYELLNIDHVRFGGLVKIIEKVLADCGWEPPPEVAPAEIVEGQSMRLLAHNDQKASTLQG
jgi:hypothetical protein